MMCVSSPRLVVSGVVVRSTMMSRTTMRSALCVWVGGQVRKWSTSVGGLDLGAGARGSFDLDVFLGAVRLGADEVVGLAELVDVPALGLELGGGHLTACVSTALLKAASLERPALGIRGPWWCLG